MRFIKGTIIQFLRFFKFYRKSFYLPVGEVCLSKIGEQYSQLHQHVSEPVSRNLPVTVETAIEKKFRNLLNTPGIKTFVIIAKNWFVWGNQGAVLTNENYLVKDVSREFDNKKHSIFYQLKLVKYNYTNKRIAVLAASGSSVYYHWMFDILPRIDILKQSGVFDKIDNFVINYLPNAYQTETLIKAGIDLSKIIPSNNHWQFHLKAEELIVPSMVSPNDCPSLQACLYLRKLFSVEMKITAAPIKIYIQRLSDRKILNEDELLHLLKAHNYKIINPETVSVAEQAAIFANACSVIGAHGAGFTNIVFCNPGTVIIDLFSPEWINPCYWIIAEHLDLKYSYLVGEKMRNEKGKAANIKIDIDKLKKLLATLTEQ